MIQVSPQVDQENAEPIQHEGESKSAGTPLAVRAAGLVLGVIAIVLASAVYELNSTLANVRAQLVQSDSQTDQVKAELGRANARSADLQLQLDRATSQRSELQAQLEKAQVRQSDLQSRLDRAGSELRSQADKAQAQASEFQARIDLASNESTRLHSELDQAKTQAEELKAQLAKARSDVAKVQPAAAKAPLLPVAATFEKNFWERGFTMHLKNLNADPLTVSIAIAGPEKAPARSATIESGGTLNVERLAAGARVVIECPGYEPLSLTTQ
jgi:septal ring factor EnvC (AmiA/AmiB activator)